MGGRIDWNLRMVGAREARKLLPSDPVDPHRIDWGSIKLGHLDTGYTEHPVFGNWSAGEQWLDVARGINRLEQGQLPRDPLDYEGNPGHGTRTASVLCGFADPPVADNGVTSEIGVAPWVPTIPCRVVNSVVLLQRDNRREVRRGLDHCVRKKCVVISISLGTPGYVPPRDGGLERAVDDAYEAGVIIVAAAGQIIDKVVFPARYRRTIGVGGVTRQRRMWWEYDEGADRVDVWAPATDILRADALPSGRGFTLAPIEGDDPGSFSVSSSSHTGKTGKGEGTSYATVHVAAAAAMWLRLRGADIDQKYSQPWQRVEAFRWLLRKTKKSINGKQPVNGTGILNIPALLREALPPASRLKKADSDQQP